MNLTERIWIIASGDVTSVCAVQTRALTQGRVCTRFDEVRDVGIISTGNPRLWSRQDIKGDEKITSLRGRRSQISLLPPPRTSATQAKKSWEMRPWRTLAWVGEQSVLLWYRSYSCTQAFCRVSGQGRRVRATRVRTARSRPISYHEPSFLATHPSLDSILIGFYKQ